jgi:hypothetical protein
MGQSFPESQSKTLLLQVKVFLGWLSCLQSWLERSIPAQRPTGTWVVPRSIRRHLTELPSNSTFDVRANGAPSNTNETHKRMDRNILPDSGKRLLYIITSSSATHSKRRDRLQDVVFPIILDAVDSFIQSNEYSAVDVYMIVSYKLSTQKISNFISLLPAGVGFQVWEEAMPMDCKRPRKVDTEPKVCRLVEGSAQLARQHRFVVKDKLPYYDFFVVFEDVGTYVLFGVWLILPYSLCSLTALHLSQKKSCYWSLPVHFGSLYSF